MNQTELKNDFYKRFSSSPESLVFSRTGLLCTLLGHSEIKNSEFISCALSMGVQSIGRRLDSSSVKLENTKMGVCTVFRLNDLTNGSKSLYDIMSQFSNMPLFGAEVLYDSTIPPCFSQDASIRTTLLNTLLKLASIENTPETNTLICAANGNPAPYAAMFSSKKGWCNATTGTKTENLPLPLTGYKLISVQTSARCLGHRSAAINSGFRTLHLIYPHVNSLSDMSFDMLDYAKNHLKHSEYNYIRHIISENERIKSAKSFLKACRIKEFADIVNSSQRSVERLWGCSIDQVFLADMIMQTGYCLCARQWKNGIIAIVQEDCIDYLINIIRRTFSSAYGFEPTFCVCDTCSTE